MIVCVWRGRVDNAALWLKALYYILGDGEDGDEEAAEAEVEIFAVEGF